MRRPFTTRQAYERGLTISELKWGCRKGVYQRVMRGVYIEGFGRVTPAEEALALLVATNGIACGTFAAHLHGLDGITREPPFVVVPNDSIRRGTSCRIMSEAELVDGYRCTTGLQTMLDLAPALDDLRYEQALESALRKRLLTIDDLVAALAVRRVGNARIRKVLQLRSETAPATESLLETLMVQLIRREPSLPTPTRQVEVLDNWNNFVARVDLAWPEVGLFIELDGEHHKEQPLHDARRETAVVAATGWLVGRFTWSEVVHIPNTTLRRLVELHRQASRIIRKSA